jgi:hypothetical protein
MKKPTLAGVALLGILSVTQIAVAGNTECTTLIGTTLLTGDVDVPSGAHCFLSGVTVVGNVNVEGSLIAEPSTITGFGTIIGGNLQGNQGSNIQLIGAIVTGNITVGGSLIAEPSPISGMGTIIGGNLQGNQASGIALVGSTLIGNLQANQTTKTSDMLGANIVCASAIGGNVQIQQSGPKAPWHIEAESALAGSVCASLSNTIRGDLQFQNNAAPGIINGNTVGGNLQFQNNTSTTGTTGDVSSNTIGNSLQCQNNVQSPTGTKGSNIVAQQKNGQCATF